ncbi:DUF397 domain-containing protein [Sphaerisporangium fuscum]|uniref:DUF397 domain-containing protein n=1 Tax=Sphaerisporangium fuscum TaxID=2835868 RepID=UPI001BDD5C07|nr:DUF397 domain-containing protein [Sphaerisporangium fuscum]
MDLNSAAWRKSSHSGGDGAQCVEVAVNLPRAVAVRDSKNPDGPVLFTTPTQWKNFISSIKRQSFNY